ncbi:MAG: tRNA (guanosine(37)-N1)-methyltransferase TrmD, partial [bacterium]|nr:tRNA (guanosine(37)-N1)-methyltransferase TrmD [bacterium]
MRFDILTIFPGFFESPLKCSLIGKALLQKKLSVYLHDIRAFATDRHKTVDAIPYGGGAGMVMKPEPLVAAVESVPRQEKSLRILLSPKGTLFDQKMAKELAQKDQLILVCGRYEGVDERVKELAIDEEISIGDYVLNGGEAAALVIVEALVRFIPGFMGNEASVQRESFEEGLLEHPQYTRPAEFRGL